MFETKIDKQTNEFLVRITKGFGMIVLNESDVRWLEKVLLFCLPPEDRVIRPAEGDTNLYESIQEALEREIDHVVFNGINEEGDK